MVKFNIEEIRKYILSQDSMGDILYNLSEENIIKANTTKCGKCDENDVEEGVSYICSSSPENHGICDFVCNCCDTCRENCHE